jgi:hypothetical protein
MLSQHIPMTRIAKVAIQHFTILGKPVRMEWLLMIQSLLQSGKNKASHLSVWLATLQDMMHVLEHGMKLE